MRAQSRWLTTELERRGVPRREFMGFCATMAAALALPDAAAAQIARRRPARGKARAAVAGIPGLRGQHRVVSESQPSKRCRSRSSTSCRSIITKRSWRRPANRQNRTRDRRDQAARRRIHRRHRRIDSHGRERRLLHDRRPRGHRHRARGVRERRRHDRDRHVRRFRRHSRGGAESDRRTGRGRRRARRQESDQSVGVSGERREPDRAARALSHLQAWPALDHLRRPLFAYGKIDPRRVRAARALRRRPVRRSVGRRRTSPGLLPVQDGLQRPRHIPELSQRPLEWRHELADRLRPSVHRLRRAGLLGSR